MKLESFDLETHAIQPGLGAPPIVCGSSAAWSKGREGAQLLAPPDIERWLDNALRDNATIIAGANIAYDFACASVEAPRLLPLIFAKYSSDCCPPSREPTMGGVVDVLITQALDALADGHMGREVHGGKLIGEGGKQTDYYSLDICTRLTLGRADAKVNDYWRKRYAILEQLPIEQWPGEAVQYPKDDAWNTVEIAGTHLGLAGGREYRNLQDATAQAETAFCLHLGAIWGFRVDRERFMGLEARVAAQHEPYVKRYQALGFIRKDAKQSEDTCAVKRAVARAYGAHGDCPDCFGKGRIQKLAPCRGEKKGGRYQGCKASAPCRENCACMGTGMVPSGDYKTCETCQGTGLDLDTAPNLPRTEKGGIKCDRDTLAESGDDDLADYGDNEFEKVRTSYLPALREGLDVPVVLSPNVLLNTGRVSYRGIWQLVPRSCDACARKLGPERCTCVRPCVRAREGRVFGSSDYSAGELCTLAQVCIWVTGASVMADTINRMKDPGALHTALGARMLGITFDEMVARLKAGDKQAAAFRQAGKPFNFGAPAGMGEAKIVLTNRKKSVGTTVGPDGRVYAGIRFCILVGGATTCGGPGNMVTEWKRKPCPPTCRACLEVAKQLRQTWFEQWPEMAEYFDWVSSTVERTGEVPAFGPWCMRENGKPHRVRGGVDFSNGANHGFQALLADGAKYALRKLTREAYTDKSSVLYDARVRVPLFAHDECFTEGDEDTAHLWGPRVAEVMVSSLREWVPDVYCHADTALMRYWYKDAKPVYDETGKLIVWEPKK